MLMYTHTAIPIIGKRLAGCLLSARYCALLTFMRLFNANNNSVDNGDVIPILQMRKQTLSD